MSFIICIIIKIFTIDKKYVKIITEKGEYRYMDEIIQNTEEKMLLSIEALEP